MPDVGIVMPVYIQKPEYLSAALRSVLTQSYKTFRLVIVIDGAKDMLALSQSIVAGDPRVEFVVHETNKGVAEALNRGFEILFQDPSILYVTWVSSDNTYSSHFVALLRDALKTGGEDLGLVYSSFRSIDGQGNSLLNEQELAIQRQYQAKPKEYLLDACITGVSFMYKSRYAKEIDGYRLQPVEDYDYWLRLTERCEIKYIPVELVDYRVNSEYSISATLQSAEKHRQWRYAYHLARHQARLRRGIPPQITILYSVSQIQADTIERLDNLYEQTFSNYEVYIIDQSLDRSVTHAISQVSHPTVAPKWLPGIDTQKAILATLQFIHTPYTYILHQGFFKAPSDLQILIQELTNADRDLVANYYTPERLVGFRCRTDTRSPCFDELFRTEHLLAAWISRNNDLGIGP
ncbi:glycosyltransferase [Paenibacillus athensensis]|uniref:Glycosyltransferase 2-like domain-containing protein n=1 Tax=Paenibacillus athensensis TaxID=1967502 RepID=A0A4Y8PX51_9BACL|nr:glycosyltransferase [Paenibacillus athensensis]MCD1260600.1 glycosyltransferase [Paenibacillus athensensis]